jgi:hypothetical protein
MEVSSNYISTTKAELLGKPAKKKPGPKPKAAALKPEPAQAQPAPAKKGALEVDEVLALRALVDRVGADNLKRVIDAMAR